MPDAGMKAAEAEFLRIRERLTRIYAQAAEDLQKKLKDFVTRYQLLDQQKRAMRDSGELTEEAYQEWVSHQVFTTKLWTEKAEEAAAMLSRANEEAAALVQQGRLTAFTAAANYGAYQVEHALGIKTSLSLYSRESVSRLILGDPQILPEWKIDQPKDYIWNYKKVQNAVTQGIIQGKPIPEIAQDLVSVLQTQNENKMTNFARTAMTGAHNAGRMDTLHRQQSLGIRVKKKWLATNDARTRDSHADLDGQVVEVDEPFVTTNRDGSTAYIDYPGDPTADAEQVYNCRCTMVYVYPDLDEIPDSVEEDPAAVHMSFDDWVEARENQEMQQPTSNPYRR